MALPHTRLPYAGATPGNDSNTYVLFASTQATNNAQWSLNELQQMGATKIKLNIKATAAGQLNAYRSSDRGVNWRQVYNEVVPALPTNQTYARELDVAGAQDFKIEWVNGGAAQTFFLVDMTLTDDQTPPLIASPLTGTATIVKANAGILKAGPGIFYKATFLNASGSAQALALVDKASAPVTGDTPLMYFAIAVSSPYSLETFYGTRFTTGIAWAEVTTFGAATITLTGTGDICVGLVEVL